MVGLRMVHFLWFAAEKIIVPGGFHVSSLGGGVKILLVDPRGIVRFRANGGGPSPHLLEPVRQSWAFFRPGGMSVPILSTGRTQFFFLTFSL